MVTPKNLASSTVLSGVPSIEYGVAQRIIFRFLVILRTSHLSTLKATSFSTSEKIVFKDNNVVLRLDSFIQKGIISEETYT